MSNEPGTPPLSEDQARAIINRWSSRGFFRLRHMGDKIFVGQVAPGAAYTVRLQTHYERRQVRQAREPYHGGPVDDRGRPPDLWDIPVSRPGAFQERTEVVAIPHTERVQMCPTCAGQGRVSCSRCAGQGRIPCPFCGGAGYVLQQVTDTVRDAQGNLVPMARSVQRRCHCGSGVVTCPGCSGNRIVRCGSCAGSGQIKTLDQLVVRFQAATQGELLDVTPVPDSWLGKLSGELLVNQEAPRIDSCPAGLPETVAHKARELLAKSHAVDERQARILLQQLHVERIPLYEVHYKYAGVDRTLWICGKEQELYAPKAPWHRQRLLGLVAAALGLVATLVGVLVFLLLR